MTKTVRGGNTNLFKTKIAPKSIIKKSKRIKKRNTRGAGIFAYLSKGLKTAANIAKRKLPTINKIAKSAVAKGTQIAKQQLRKPAVQKALRSAVSEGTKLAANHVLKTVSGDSYQQFGKSYSKRPSKKRKKGKIQPLNTRNRLLYQE